MYRWIKRLIVIFCMFCLMVTSYNIGYASELTNEVKSTTKETNIEVPQKVEQYATGVVKLCLYVVDDNGDKQNIRQGAGILLGTNDVNNDDGQVVLTDNSFVEIDDETIQIIRRQYGLKAEDEISVGVDIILDLNTRISTEIQNSGEGYVILAPNNKLKDMQMLVLGDSSSLQVRDSLFILGYGGESDTIGSIGISNLERCINACQIAELKEEEIVTNYQISSGDIGNPVMDVNGNVVGMLTKNREGVLTIKSIDNIKAILDILGVIYESSTPGSNYNKVTKDIYLELTELLVECQELAMSKDQYTKKSIDKLKAVINKAMEILNSNNATYDDYQNSIDELNKYKKKLRSKSYPYHIVQILTLVLIVFFLWRYLCNRKNIRLLLDQNEKSKIEPSHKKASSVMRVELVRCDTGEQIYITKDIYRIGKNIDQMDYAITDNSSISRHHADIEMLNGLYYIVDQNSTNHTYVNGVMVASGQRKEIHNGDIVQLSNIQFKIKIVKK